MTNPIRKPKNTPQKRQFPCPHKTFFFASHRKLPETLFYCDSPNFEMRVCVFAHIFLPHKLQIVLLVNLTKRKKHTFVDLTKLKSFIFRPHKLHRPTGAPDVHHCQCGGGGGGRGRRRGLDSGVVVVDTNRPPPPPPWADAAGESRRRRRRRRKRG